jgi:predicted amidophosphoribosyltransferase
MIEVARALQRNSGLKILSVLQRLRGGPQKGLRFEDRLANIQGMIVLPKNSRPLSQRVVLIDDIFTSGATADECARVLRRAGVREVQVLTLAAEL